MNPAQMLAIIYGFVACGATTVGILIIYKYNEWGVKNVVYFISFAAGLLITVSVLHLIPESLNMNTSAPIFILIGFLAFNVYDRFLDNHVIDNSGKGNTSQYSLGIISAWGIGIHSFIDGIVFMVTFSVSTFTGIATSTALIFHEIPEGIITFMLLREAGLSEKKSVFFAFLAAAISTPLGVVLAFPFINHLGLQELGIMLAIAAGGLLYVGASRLLPEGEKGPILKTLMMLAIGVVLAMLVIFLSH